MTPKHLEPFLTDAVIMAIEGTNDQQLADWWLRAIEDVFSIKYPYLESQVKDVTNTLSWLAHYQHENPDNWY